MNIIEIMNQRKSVRHYQLGGLTTPVQEKVSALVDATGSGPFGHSPRIRLLKVQDQGATVQKSFATYGMIKGAEYFLGAAIHQRKEELVDLGYVIEKLILHITAENLGTCWLGGTFKKDRIEKLFSTSFGMSAEEYVPFLIPVGVPAREPRMLDRVIKMIAKSDKRKPLSELFFAHNGELAKVDLSSWWGKALHGIQIAPSSQNLQPWRINFDEEHKQFDFYIKGSSYVDLGIAMSHFELAAESYGVTGKWVDKALAPKDESLEYILSWEKSSEEA